VTEIDIYLADGSDEGQLFSAKANRTLIAEGIPAANGEFDWFVPELDGKWFYFIIESSGDDRVSGQSGYVAISRLA